MWTDCVRREHGTVEVPSSGYIEELLIEANQASQDTTPGDEKNEEHSPLLSPEEHDIENGAAEGLSARDVLKTMEVGSNVRIGTDSSVASRITERWRWRARDLEASSM